MIIKNCNVSKLHKEFIAVVIKPYPVFELENGDGDFTFLEGTDMDLVQQIVDAHDPTPLPPHSSKEDLLEQRINDLELYILMKEELI